MLMDCRDLEAIPVAYAKTWNRANKLDLLVPREDKR